MNGPCRFPRRVILALLALSLATVQHARAQSNEDWDGSLEQRLDGFITVWSEAKYNFPFFDQRPGLDWDAEMREYLPRVIAAESIDAYYAVLSEYAALLHDGHSGVNPPGGRNNFV